MLWPDGWGLQRRLTFHWQFKKKTRWGSLSGWRGGRRGAGQVCTGPTGSPRIPAPPVAGRAGIVQCLEVSAVLPLSTGRRSDSDSQVVQTHFNVRSQCLHMHMSV